MPSLWLLQKDTRGVHSDPDSSAVEASFFSTRELISVKQEQQRDTKVSCNSHFRNRIAVLTYDERCCKCNNLASCVILELCICMVTGSNMRIPVWGFVSFHRSCRQIYVTLCHMFVACLGFWFCQMVDCLLLTVSTEGLVITTVLGSPSALSVQCRWCQFPLYPAFAMSINKAQWQFLEFSDVDTVFYFLVMKIQLATQIVG
jgi:hypothetical protein